MQFSPVHILEDAVIVQMLGDGFCPQINVAYPAEDAGDVPAIQRQQEPVMADVALEVEGQLADEVAKFAAFDLAQYGAVLAQLIKAVRTQMDGSHFVPFCAVDLFFWGVGHVGPQKWCCRWDTHGVSAGVSLGAVWQAVGYAIGIRFAECRQIVGHTVADSVEDWVSDEAVARDHKVVLHLAFIAF